MPTSGRRCMPHQTPSRPIDGAALVRRPRRTEARPLADLSDFRSAELSDFRPALTPRGLMLPLKRRCAMNSNTCAGGIGYCSTLRGAFAHCTGSILWLGQRGDDYDSN